MSVTRDIMFDSRRSIEETTALLNQALDPDRRLHVRTVESPTGSWRIAEGVVAGYPAVLTDTKGLDDAESRGFSWSLGLACAMRPAESYEMYGARCTQDAAGIMRRIGALLGSRCMLLENMQRRVGSYP